MDDDDFQIEKILEAKKSSGKKKKVDGRAKGNRTELGLCKLLGDHFGVDFTKTPGSGALSTVRLDRLPEHAKKTLTGDICVPEKFKWVIECKGGYEKEIDLCNVLEGNGSPTLDTFIEQSSRDSDFCGRMPIICWKRNRKPWLAMIRLKDLCHNDDISKLEMEEIFSYRLYYRDWLMFSLEELLKESEREFWFEEKK